MRVCVHDFFPLFYVQLDFFAFNSITVPIPNNQEYVFITEAICSFLHFTGHIEIYMYTIKMEKKKKKRNEETKLESEIEWIVTRVNE